MKNLRIAFVTFEYPPHTIGGAGIYASSITTGLADLGHSVVVFTPRINTKSRYSVFDTVKNIEVIRIKTRDYLPFKALQFWIKLPSVILKANGVSKFDVIHINGISYGFLKKRILRIPHIITIHHLVKDAIEKSNRSLGSRFLNIGSEESVLMPLIEKRCIDSADKIIAVSNYTKQKIKEFYQIPKNRIEVIHNGVYPSINFKQDELLETRKILKLPDKHIILFVGRVDDPRKNLQSLIRGFKRLNGIIDVALLIVGEGNQAKAQSLANSLNINEDVIFTGFLDRSSLLKCYSLCDIYVCPSNLEGFGLTVVEALAAGTPVIAKKAGAICELIINGHNGTVLERIDSDLFIEAVSKILRQKHNPLYRVSIKGSVVKYSWQVACEKISQVYESIQLGND